MVDTPADLRLRADKCERLASQIPSEDDARTLRLMAAEYRDAADRLERRGDGISVLPI
jgi:hypothetical protein